MANRVASQRSQLRAQADRQRAQLAALQESFAAQLAQVRVGSQVDTSAELAELETLERELDARRQQLNDAERELQQSREVVAERARRIADDAQDVQRQKERYDERLAKLDEEFEAIETEKARTTLQRKRIAEQFREDRRQRGERVDVEQFKVQIRQLTEERDTLNALLTDAQEQLRDQPVAIGGTSVEPDTCEELETLQGKYDLAMTDLRELRKRNADLESRVAQSVQTAASSGAMDWESQKRRMLAALEAEERDTPIAPQRADDRLTIEGTIHITDQMIADKDREIAELKQLLEAQSQNVGNVAVGAAAIGAMFDTDEIIRQERERLELLETELQEKLRQAEIELSRERARLARDRVEIDELKRALDLERQKFAAPVDASGRKVPGGNWLARLGLKADQE